MSLTLTTEAFVSRHPEFCNVGEVLIQAAIANAATLVSEASFGAHYNLAVEYKACSLLASGKYGQIDPKSTQDQVDSYEAIYRDIAKRIPIRMLIT